MGRSPRIKSPSEIIEELRMKQAAQDGFLSRLHQMALGDANMPLEDKLAELQEWLGILTHREKGLLPSLYIIDGYVERIRERYGAAVYKSDWELPPWMTTLMLEIGMRGNVEVRA